MRLRQNTCKVNGHRAGRTAIGIPTRTMASTGDGTGTTNASSTTPLRPPPHGYPANMTGQGESERDVYLFVGNGGQPRLAPGRALILVGSTSEAEYGRRRGVTSRRPSPSPALPLQTSPGPGRCIRRHCSHITRSGWSRYSSAKYLDPKREHGRRSVTARPGESHRTPILFSI